MRFLINVLITVAGTAVAAIPTLLFLGMRGFLSPEGFFQEFFVLGIGIWIFGAWQLLFFILWVIGMFFTWTMA